MNTRTHSWNIKHKFKFAEVKWVYGYSLTNRKNKINEESTSTWKSESAYIQSCRHNLESLKYSQVYKIRISQNYRPDVITLKPVSLQIIPEIPDPANNQHILYLKVPQFPSWMIQVTFFKTGLNIRIL